MNEFSDTTSPTAESLMHKCAHTEIEIVIPGFSSYEGWWRLVSVRGPFY
jgi:hypothetical protein